MIKTVYQVDIGERLEIKIYLNITKRKFVVVSALAVLAVFSLYWYAAQTSGDEILAKPAPRVNVKDYGAKGNGVSNDAPAIQAAANAAKRTGRSLYIPSGNYYIASGVIIYTSVLCEGTIKAPNNIDGRAITISRTAAGRKLNPQSLSGLTRGSTSISGLKGNKGGTLVLESTETLIIREGYSSDGWYTCNEASVITNAYGGIWPALDCTYKQRGKLKATVYPYEKPIWVVGLKVESVGDKGGAEVLVWCNRSNVNFKNISVINKSNVADPSYGFLATNCVNIVIDNPRIDNFDGAPSPDLSYGFSLSQTANIEINNADVTRCYHALAGRHAKVVTVNGGYWDQVLDCHWGSDYVITGATIIFEVAYAGTNITIKDCTFRNCYQILFVRGDTPELMGNVIIDNCTADQIADTNSPFYGVYYPDYRAARDFGRVLGTSSLISVTNVTAKLGSPNRVFYVVSTPWKIAQTNDMAPIGSIVVGNIMVNQGSIVDINDGL